MIQCWFWVPSSSETPRYWFVRPGCQRIPGWFDSWIVIFFVVSSLLHMFWLMWRLMFYHWVPQPISKAKHLITLELLHLLKVPSTHDWAKLKQVVGEQPARFRCWSTFAAALYLDGRHMAALEWHGKSTSSAACQQIHTLECIQWSTPWPRRFARPWFIPTFYRFLVLIISNHFPRADKRCTGSGKRVATPGNFKLDPKSKD